MPKKNQRTITISLKTYETVEEMAMKKGQSVAGYLTDLISKKCQGVQA